MRIWAQPSSNLNSAIAVIEDLLLLWTRLCRKPPACVKDKTLGKLCSQFSGFYLEVMSENAFWGQRSSLVPLYTPAVRQLPKKPQGPGRSVNYNLKVQYELKQVLYCWFMPFLVFKTYRYVYIILLPTHWIFLHKAGSKPAVWHHYSRTGVTGVYLGTVTFPCMLWCGHVEVTGFVCNPRAELWCQHEPSSIFSFRLRSSKQVDPVCYGSFVTEAPSSVWSLSGQHETDHS